MMLFAWILCGLIILVGIIVVANWWRDERGEFGGMVKSASYAAPALSGNSRVLHPSIDPYLAELRAYLLMPPLPRGPGEMAERVYTHLNLWMSTHLTQDAPYDTDLEGDLLIEPTSHFVDVSRNDPVAPAAYLEDLAKEGQ